MLQIRLQSAITCAEASEASPDDHVPSSTTTWRLFERESAAQKQQEHRVDAEEHHEADVPQREQPHEPVFHNGTERTPTAGRSLDRIAVRQQR